MGQRGPKPKSAALKMLAGRKLPTGSGRVRKGRPDRPVELTGEAAREWDSIANELDAAGTLAVVDRGVLAAYCCAVADVLAARDAINREGRWLTEPLQNSKGDLLGERVKEHPAVKLLDKATVRVRGLAADLGLTPASRSRQGDTGSAEQGAAADNPVLALREQFKR